MVVSRLRSRY